MQAAAPTATNPLLAEWPEPFGLPPFEEHRASAVPPGLRRGARGAQGRARGHRHDSAAGPISPTRSTRWSCRAGSCAGSRRSSSTSPPPTRARSCRRSSGRSPRSSPATTTASTRTRGSSPGSRPWSSGRRASGSAPSRPACWSATTRRSCAMVPPSTTRPGHGSARSRSGWRRSAPSSRRTCWPTSSPTSWCSTARPIWPACRPSSAMRRRQPPGRAAWRASTSSRLPARAIEPFLTFSTRRDLREIAFGAWTKRGENGGATDNRAIIKETIALRAERARLLGYQSFAHYRLADSMARTPEAALGLLHSVWGPARERALADAAELQAIGQADGLNDAARRLGLAPSGRKAPPGALRHSSPARSSPISRSMG